MNKVKTLIVNDNQEIISEIRKCLEKIEYVEVIGECKEGNKIYEKIVELRPNIVFMKYQMNDCEPIKIMTKVTEVLQEKTPMFKFLSDDLSVDKVAKKYNVGENEKVLIKEMGIPGIIEMVNLLKE